MSPDKEFRSFSFPLSAWSIRQRSVAGCNSPLFSVRNFRGRPGKQWLAWKGTTYEGYRQYCCESRTRKTVGMHRGEHKAKHTIRQKSRKPFGTDDSGPEGQKAYRDCIKSRWAFQSADKACNHKARRPAYARAAILGFAFTVTIFRPLAPACCKNAGLASESVMSMSISDSSAKLNTAFFSSLLESHSR